MFESDIVYHGYQLKQEITEPNVHPEMLLNNFVTQARGIAQLPNIMKEQIELSLGDSKVSSA